MADPLSAAVIRVVRRRPFYGTVLASLVRVYGERGAAATGTAAVRISGDARLDLVVNPHFFEALSPSEQEAVLVHECLHVLHLHLARLRGFSDPQLANVAMDIAINQHIEGLPAGALLPASFPEAGLEPGWTADAYYEALVRASPEVRERARAAGALDDHAWGQAGGLAPALAEAACRTVAEEAVARGRTDGTWGDLPAGLRRLLAGVVEPQVDWRRALRQFVGEDLRLGTRTTRKRKNRRYGWDQPGTRPVRGPRLLVALDTSGSISARMLSAFFAEIDALSLHAEVVVAEVDARVQRVYAYRRGEHPEPLGGGGTSFQVLWDALARREHAELRRKPDGIVYLTDGDAPWPRASLGFPTLWVLTRPRSDVPFGRAVTIDV